MKLVNTLIPLLSIKQAYSISCYPDAESDINCVICEDLTQTLAGLSTIDWAQYGQIAKLKLKLNDDEASVNQGYLSVLEATLAQLSENLLELSLVHFNGAITNKVLKKAPNLETLHISKTQIDSLPDRLFKDTLVESFKIADSEMTTLNNQVFGSSNLKKLKLERNKLHTLEEDSFAHLASLEHLDLSDNNIDNVNVEVMKHLVNLKKVDLDNNGLTFIPEDFFKKNRELRHLSLAGNNLKALPCDLLKYHFSLSSLNIANNDFSTIPCHLISRQGEQLIEFNATDNQIHDRYNKDLSHKRGVAHKLNKKGLKANGKVISEIADRETKQMEFLEGNENQIAGTLSMVCDICDRLPPRKKLKRKEKGQVWDPFNENEAVATEGDNQL